MAEWEVRTGDCLELLRGMPDGSVHMVATSPPYWGLRDYGTASWDGGDAGCDHVKTTHHREQPDRPKGWDGAFRHTSQPLPVAYGATCGKCGAVRKDRQLGLEPTPDEYVASMVRVFREVRRVLRADGVMFLNLGDSYHGGAGRGGAYGTPDKAPEDSPASDCPCRSLCDACRVAYRYGRARNGHQHAPTPSASPSATTPGRTASVPVRPPTSHYGGRHDRNAVATQDRQPTVGPGLEQPHASPVSTPDGSSPLPQGEPHPSDIPSACLLCGCSLTADAPGSADTSACTCDIGTPGGASDQRMSDTASSDSAYLHSTSGSRLKAKDLVGIPWAVAFALRADGWYLRSEVVWSKPNPMPESVTDRPTRAHEQVFLLTKNARYFYDSDAIREPPALATVADRREPYSRPSNGNQADVLAEVGHPVPTPEGGRNKRSVWQIATVPFPGAHFAVFPPKLVEPMILAGSPKDGTVLDPFCGAGTTGVVALRHDRSFIGLELNPEYAELARLRIRDDMPLMNSVSEVAA